MENRTIATVKATKADAAEIRYRMAARLKRMLIAGELYENTWMIRASERGE